MKRKSILLALASAFAFATAAPVFADKPSWAGKGKGHEERDDDNDQGRGKHKDKRGKHFDDNKRVAVREYYEHEFQGGKRCPPGLAKKHNGCMPPGQARKWQMGQPLPSDVVYYPVPHDLEIRIGLPPAGYKYVRVASDILMIAAGTGLVVDAVQDLGRF
jgi:Ni/Co efflux regulator RcnB